MHSLKDLAQRVKTWIHGKILAIFSSPFLDPTNPPDRLKNSRKFNTTFSRGELTRCRTKTLVERSQGALQTSPS